MSKRRRRKATTHERIAYLQQQLEYAREFQTFVVDALKEHGLIRIEGNEMDIVLKNEDPHDHQLPEVEKQ